MDKAKPDAAIAARTGAGGAWTRADSVTAFDDLGFGAPALDVAP